MALAERRGDRVVRVDGAVCVRSSDPAPFASRAVVLRPDADAAAISAAYSGHPGGARVEDAFAALDLAPYGFERDYEMNLMVRAPGPLAAESEVVVKRVGSVEDLRTAERTIVEGFPMRGRGDGSLLPEAVLGLAGYAVWLARLGGAPAGAMASYDDGASLGVYYLATLPAARRRGAGRALLAAAVAAAPERPAVLTATAAGEPLYARCGFEIGGRAAWWWRDAP